MENQHKRISGYRDLTQDEIDLINMAKHLEAQVLRFHAKVGEKLDQQKHDAEFEPSEFERIVQAEPGRWHAIARTDIERGFMALVRAFAQPQPRVDE